MFKIVVLVHEQKNRGTLMEISTYLAIKVENQYLEWLIFGLP
jgi:hypothetical protein